jgi:hypothetical protein
MAPDPGNPQSLNRCSYALNNPIKHRDPSGHTSSDPGQSTIDGDGQLVKKVASEGTTLNVGTH